MVSFYLLVSYVWIPPPTPAVKCLFFLFYYVKEDNVFQVQFHSHITHFSPSEAAFHSETFFLICSYRKLCVGRERSVPKWFWGHESRKHMRWMTACHLPASSQIHCMLTLATLLHWVTGRCWSGPHSLPVELVFMIFSFLESFLIQLREIFQLNLFYFSLQQPKHA